MFFVSIAGLCMASCTAPASRGGFHPQGQRPELVVGNLALPTASDGSFYSDFMLKALAKLHGQYFPAVEAAPRGEQALCKELGWGDLGAGSWPPRQECCSLGCSQRCARSLKAIQVLS